MQMVVIMCLHGGLPHHPIRQHSTRCQLYSAEQMFGSFSPEPEQPLSRWWLPLAAMPSSRLSHLLNLQDSMTLLQAVETDLWAAKVFIAPQVLPPC